MSFHTAFPGELYSAAADSAGLPAGIGSGTSLVPRRREGVGGGKDEREGGDGPGFARRVFWRRGRGADLRLVCVPDRLRERLGRREFGADAVAGQGAALVGDQYADERGPLDRVEGGIGREFCEVVGGSDPGGGGRRRGLRLAGFVPARVGE